MKTSNKYSGKKLYRPEIEKPFVKINRGLITCKDLSDFEFRLICFLFSYSNGTTITTKNLSEKLNKSERRILEVFSRLASLEILKFTDTHIELFISSDLNTCEIPQCDNSHPENADCDSSHNEVRDSSALPAKNDRDASENSQLNTLESIDNIDVTEPYNIISNNKKSIDNNINNKSSITSDEDFSINNFEDQKTDNNNNSKDLEETHTPIDSEMNTIPVIDKDFIPKEVLEKGKSKVDGRLIWKLKNKVTSKFIHENYTYKFVDIYNQWINLDIKEHSRYSFAVFEFVAVYMLVTTDKQKLIINNESLNRYVRIYPIDDIPKHINGYFDEAVDDPDKIKNVIKPFTLPID